MTSEDVAPFENLARCPGTRVARHLSPSFLTYLLCKWTNVNTLCRANRERQRRQQPEDEDTGGAEMAASMQARHPEINELKAFLQEVRTDCVVNATMTLRLPVKCDLFYRY